MKKDFLNALKEADNFTFTENGAVALKSTGNSVLDAFGSLAAMKDSSDTDILNTFYRAFFADKELAMRLLFYVRDIRGGQGMRRIFRVIVRNLAFTKPELVINNFDNFLFFGRGDDLLCLFDTPVEADMMGYVCGVLNDDLKSVDAGNGCTLLAKWMPSINTSSNEARRLANKFIRYLGISSKQYRQMLSKLRAEIGIVEKYMSANEWDKINFEKLPAKAAMIYSDAFMKHVIDNYMDYLKAVAAGDAKVNAASLFPVDIIHTVMEKGNIDCWCGRTAKETLKDRLLYNAMWEALPNYFGDTEETGICVVDTSGSMSGIPLEVALSLGMYCADKAKGPFANHFITFSDRPALQEVVGDNIFEKVRNMITADWSGSTDIEAVFDLILTTAKANNLKQEDLPSKLYIISDMQFNEASGCSRSYGVRKKITFMDSMKQKFADAGYIMPAIVYWNVRASKCGMFQQKVDGEDCCMVSGYSASLFKSVIEGTEFVEETTYDGKTVIKQKIDPMNVMLTTLNNERYDRVYTGVIHD